MCREAFAPLNIAHAHLLAGEEGSMPRVLLANITTRAGVTRKPVHPKLPGASAPCLDKLWVYTAV